MPKELDEERIHEYYKMRALRNVAKQMPNSQLDYAIKSLDRQYNKIIKKSLNVPKKKKAFVTKF